MNKIAVGIVIIVIAIFGFIIFKNQPMISNPSIPSNSPNPPISRSPLQDNLKLEDKQDLQSSLNPNKEMNLQSNVTPSPTLIPQTQTQPPTKATKALLRTSKGDIILALYPDDAPATVENFAKKAASGFYKGLTFHRVEDWVVQGADPKGNGTGGSVMPTELNKKPFITGSLGVARRDDIRISNDAQFFVTKKDAPWLNEQYTNFGLVVEGLDTVSKLEIGDKILDVLVQ